MISEVRMATLSVANLAAARGFYENVFDYVCHGSGSLGGKAHESLWRMPEGLGGEYCLLGPRGSTSGLLRLMQFDRAGQSIWGAYEHPENYGHYALNIRVPEIQPAMDRIRSQGGRTKSEPTRWTVTPEITAWDSLSYDPDGIVLDVFELEPAEGSLMADYDGRCSALQTMALHVSDARRSARFYAALGFRPWYDKLLQNMEGFFKLPPGTALHNINMIIPGQESVGRIEIAQYVGFPGKSLRTVAVPPNTGILGIAMETRDLAATTQLLNSIGAEANSPVVQTTVAHIGSVNAITYYGPDDELLEFFQRLA